MYAYVLEQFFSHTSLGNLWYIYRVILGYLFPCFMLSSFVLSDSSLIGRLIGSDFTFPSL
jgi:hypothetical protein